MRFFSDNAAPAHPAVLEAILAANGQDTAYDGDSLSRRLDARFGEVFGCEVAVLWVPSGTAANCLALTAMCPPHGGIVCHADAHIQNDEGGAPEFYTHGAKLMLLGGEQAKLTPDAITAFLSTVRDDVHQVQPHVVSITQATEAGCVYTAQEVAAIGAMARERRLGLHMDGARFANAVAYLGCTPAEVTWKAGVDALSFGFIKNGGMSAEALVFFRPELAKVAKYRRKRAGLLASKGRFLAAQLLAMLDDDVWLTNARTANVGAAMLAEAAGERLVHPVQANEVFVRLNAQEAAGLRAQGFDFYDWGAGQARLVVAWDQGAEIVAPLARAIAAL
ncbi:threonine aldolase family protein [Sphingomonas sp. Leaf25]|uniref:threonine aldolase family protein n=1 Tax=Sphingomonas sp. Leaf25 TaxID=1735692 RepID=UPI0006F695E7|nr:low specificity L-threonine aldolase [Sphingomonas sp. Leaf25]KQM97670.1 threonine aldolase [Sphingomonas sp. Leaf25]